MIKLFIVTLLFVLSVNVESARILIVFPAVTESHALPLQTIVWLLTEKNHEVTFVSTFPIEKPMKNLRQIQIPFDENEKNFLDNFSHDSLRITEMITLIKNMTSLVLKTGNTTFQLPEMRRIMEEEQYELIIIGYFMTEFLFGLGDHFKAPVVVLSSSENFGILDEIIGNPFLPSGEVHSLLQYKYSVKNLIMHGMEKFTIRFLMRYFTKQLYNEIFPSDRYCSFEDSIKGVSLLLLNTQINFARQFPYLPNTILIGGFQPKPLHNELSEDLKEFLDSANDGAILFSMSPNLKSSYLPEKTIAMLLSTFSQLKQKVVMIWESDMLEEKPDNVFISKRLQQNDVLAHQNVKLFISHCGNKGTIFEAKYHGIKMICSPFYGDQQKNADELVIEGYAKKINLLTVTVDEMKHEIDEILSLSRYTYTANQMSYFLKDRSIRAQHTFMNFIEMILAYQGIPFHPDLMQTRLPFFEDSMENIFSITCFIVAISVIAFITFACKWFSKRSENDKDKKTQ